MRLWVFQMRVKNPAAVALGRLGGLAKSQRKAEAVRANGKKGGRPKKSAKRVQVLKDYVTR